MNYVTFILIQISEDITFKGYPKEGNNETCRNYRLRDTIP